jgi:chromosome partitioning protein
MRLGFRIADGITERVIFREYFPMGLTALDDHSAMKVGSRGSLSVKAARAEVEQLIRTLQLPIDEHGIKRAKTRKLWLQNSYQPVELPDIFAE